MEIVQCGFEHGLRNGSHFHEYFGEGRRLFHLYFQKIDDVVPAKITKLHGNLTEPEFAAFLKLQDLLHPLAGDQSFPHGDVAQGGAPRTLFFQSIHDALFRY